MSVGFVVVSMPREHDSTGDFVETVTHENVLAVFDRVDGPPVITTSDIAAALGCVPDTARGKLTELERTGTVANRSTAGRTLWWRTDAESEDPESERFPITDCSLDFYSGDAAVTFSNGVTLAVTSDEAGTSFELTHPDNAAETWTDSIERRPAEILLEILDDYYTASGEDRAVTVPALDTYMQEVETDE